MTTTIPKPSPAADLARAQAERVFFTWSVQRDVRPMVLDQARGARFHTVEHGWLWDLESQVYNVNIGHGHAHVQDRMIDQIRTQPTAAPNMILPIRAELGALLHRHTGMEKFFFATGGSEAVENAIKIARLVTGRSKIVTRRNSYHGATLAALGVAGDPRKLPFARDLPPAYHIEDPFPCPAGEPSAWVASLVALIDREDPARSPRSCSRASPAPTACSCRRPTSGRGSASCATRTGSCSSTTRSSAASAAPGGGSRASTGASAPT
jgi:taurine--2-oxoglutarate transaminase